MYPINDELISIEVLIHLWCQVDTSISTDPLELTLWDAFWDGDVVLCDNSRSPTAVTRKGLLLKFVGSRDGGPVVRDHPAANNPLPTGLRSKETLSEKEFTEVFGRMKGVSYFDLNDGAPSFCRWPAFLRLRVRRDDFRQLCLLRAWPLPRFWFSDQERLRWSARAEVADAELRRWLRIDVFAGPWRSKEATWDEARRRFATSRPKLDAAWRELAPPHWKMPGRPRESERHNRD